MAKKIFVGNDNNIAKTPSKILVGNSSNIARKVTNIFVGNSSNQAVRVYPNSHGLPSAFQECEYIFNSGGTQYINLDFKASSDTSISMDVVFTKKLPSSGSFRNNLMFGVYQQLRTSDGYMYFKSTYCMYGSYGSANYIYLYFGGNGTQGSSHDTFSTTIQINKHYVIEMKNKHFLVNGNDKGSSTKTFSNTSANMLIFGGNLSEENQGFQIVKMQEGMQLYHFRAQAYDGTLIRDMYPCYMKSDSLIVGMYDLVSTTFYGNSGTGYFDKGPNVG